MGGIYLGVELINGNKGNDGTKETYESQRLLEATRTSWSFVVVVVDVELAFGGVFRITKCYVMIKCWTCDWLTTTPSTQGAPVKISQHSLARGLRQKKLVYW